MRVTQLLCPSSFGEWDMRAQPSSAMTDHIKARCTMSLRNGTCAINCERVQSQPYLLWKHRVERPGILVFLLSGWPSHSHPYPVSLLPLGFLTICYFTQVLSLPSSLFFPGIHPFHHSLNHSFPPSLHAGCQYYLHQGA